MSSTTLALAASPSGVRSNVAWRVLLAFARSWPVAALAQIEIKLPFTPVPITGQTLGVLLVGASLGAGLGGVSMLLYLAQGALGLPFYSGGDSGAEFLRLSAVTGGYLRGFVLSAAVVGALAQRGWDPVDPDRDRGVAHRRGRPVRGRDPVAHAGARRVVGEALEIGLAPFVVGDTLKLFAAAGLLPIAWRVVRKRSG